MSLPRFHIDSPLTVDSEHELAGNTARYIGRVLRLGPQDEITLLNGLGGEYRATITAVGKSKIAVTITEFVERDVESPLSIHLLQGISRGERMDLVIQKATELGVQRITPLITDHSVVKLEPRRAEKRLLHWRGIAASACEQSGRNSLPLVSAPQPFRTWLGENVETAGTRLILKPGSDSSMRSLDNDIQSVILLIGPEGGFSSSEYELAEATGFRALGFGERILRTETAAIAAIAALQTLFGDLAPN